MVEDYLTIETRFLVPLVLAVAVLVYRRDEAEEIRFLWTATGIAVAFVALNSLLVWQGKLSLPASIAFLLLVTAYAIHPAVKASLAAAAGGGLAAWAAALGTVAATGGQPGSFEAVDFKLPAAIAAVAAGLATTVAMQLLAWRRAETANVGGLSPPQ